MQPTETRRVLPLVDRLPTLSVILVRPHAGPEFAVVGSDHTALSSRGHYLVLAERPSTNVSNGANRTPFITSSMRLGTILDHLQPMLLGQRHDRVHVARPSCQVNTDDRLGALGQDSTDGVNGHVLGIQVDIGEYWNGPDIDDGRSRGQECPRGHHHLIANSDPKGLQCYIQGNGSISESDSEPGVGPGRKFFFKLAALLAGPVIDPVGQDNISNGIGLLFGK